MSDDLVVVEVRMLGLKLTQLLLLLGLKLTQLLSLIGLKLMQLLSLLGLKLTQLLSLLGLKLMQLLSLLGLKLTQLLSLSTTRVVIALPLHVLCPLFSIKESMWPFAAFCQQMFQDLDHPQWEVKSSAHTHMHAHWFGSLLTSCRCLGVIAILHRNDVKCSSCHSDPSIKGDMSVCPASAHCLRMAW